MMKTYKEILDFVNKAGSNHVTIFGGEFEGGYELQQSPQEIASFLFDNQGKVISNFLEIGTAAGGNTRIICDFLDVENVYTVDLNEHPSIPKARKKNFEGLKIRGELRNFWGDSHSKAAAKWIGSFEVEYDLAFIDGDHTEEGVRKDAIMTMPFLKKGALVIFHDTVVKGVGCSQFDKKLKMGEIKELKLVKDYVGGLCPKGIGVYRYDP